MYNGIGLQTARGSGTNGYVQNNKFFVRPRNVGKPVNGGKGFEDDQGTAGLSKKPNKDILEHDRKRQIHLKLAILEEKLADQGYSDAEIAQKLQEARVNLEAASEETDDAPKISETQTHQVAARKEKQMEAFRAALGLPDPQQAEEGLVGDDEPMAEGYEGGRMKERREHSFLDRDSRRKFDGDADEKEGKGKEGKKHDDLVDEVKRHKKKKEGKKRRHDGSSDSDEDDGDRRRRSKKKAKGRKHKSDSSSSDSESDSSGSESESESDDGKKRSRKKATKKRSRSKRSVSSESEDVESDDSTRLKKSHKRSRPSREVRGKHDEQRRAGRKRHDSDVSEPESEEKKQLGKQEETYRGRQKQHRGEENVGRYRGDSGDKKAVRDSDDSETEFQNKKQQLRSKVEVYSEGTKQRRDEEEDVVPRHGDDRYRSDSRGKKIARDSEDSEAEYENRRKLKDDEIYQKRRRTVGEDRDYDNHGRNRYRSDDVVKGRGTTKEDNDEDGYNKHKMDRYRGRAIEEEEKNKKGEDDEYRHDRDRRYKQRRDSVKEDEEEYKRGGDRDGSSRKKRSSGSHGDRD